VLGRACANDGTKTARLARKAYVRIGSSKMSVGVHEGANGF